MIATFRLARQTSRWSRFAAVTVEVTAAPVDAVMMSAEAVSPEAVLGGWHALRHSPASDGGRRVTITAITTTEMDTGVGDVYEATARAVWQALGVERKIAPVGFTDPEMIGRFFRRRIGLALTGVTEARHRFPGSDTSLLHFWLQFGHGPSVMFHGMGDDLELSVVEQYADYDMDQYGEVRVAPAVAPSPLAGLVGRPLTDAAVLPGPFGPSRCAGVRLLLGDHPLVIETVADEWSIVSGSPGAR